MLKRFAAGASGGPDGFQQALLRANMSIPELRALSPLEDNAQKLVDKAVVEVGLERLTVFADVLAAGLTMPITDPLSVGEVQWEQISKAGGAQRTMNPSARGENEAQNRRVKRIPVYLTTDDFSIGIRTLRTSQRSGTPLDTSLVKEATRRVNEAFEDAIINGASIQVDGYTTPGLVNAPNAVTNAYSSNEAWTAAGHDGEDILADVLTAIGKLQAKKKYGPYNLYVGTSYGIKLMQDFKANSDITIMARLQEIQSGGRNLVVRVADQLPTDTTLLIQMTSDVVDIIDGQRPTVVPWTSADGFTLFWLVMGIMIPRVRDDYDGNSGICVCTTT